LAGKTPDHRETANVLLTTWGKVSGGGQGNQSEVKKKSGPPSKRQAYPLNWETGGNKSGPGRVARRSRADKGTGRSNFSLL